MRLSPPIKFFQSVLPQQRHRYTLIRGAIYLSLVSELWSCSNLAQSGINNFKLRLGNVTNIHDLRLEQGSKSTVYLQGKVVHLVPLLKQKVYQLQDSTGTIWVLTALNTVELGEQILIKGELRYQSIPLGGKDFGEVYIEAQEIERIK